MKTKKNHIILSVFILLSIITISFIWPKIEWDNNLFSRESKNYNQQNNELKLLEGTNQNEIASSYKEINDLSFEIIPQPAHKRLFLLTGNITHTQQEIDEANKLVCYELRISHKTGMDILKLPSNFSFEESVMYFTSFFAENIKLIIDNDTLKCQMYHYERNYGVSPYQSIQLGFPYEKDWQNKKHKIVIIDEYFGIGLINLESTY